MDKVGEMLKNDNVIRDICNLFGIRETWLKGESHSIYEYRSFYGCLSDVFEEISNNIYKGSLVEVYFATTEDVTLEKLKRIDLNEDGKDYAYLRVLLKITRTISGVKMSSYQVWDNLLWDHMKARKRGKAIITFCRQNGIPILAISLSEMNYIDFMSNRQFFSSLLDCGRPWKVY